jgi:hypothetical protein
MGALDHSLPKNGLTIAARPDEEGAPTRDALVTARAFAVLLNRRARHGAIGAEHAAIAGLGLKPAAAAAAVVEELAGVRRHSLCGLMAAGGTSQRRFNLHAFLT